MSRTTSIATDWQDCKTAYDDAVFFTSVSRGWANSVTQGWRDDLAEKALAFEAKYGIEFNPHIPVDASIEPTLILRKEVAV